MKGQRHSTACSRSSAEPSCQCESAWWGKVCSLALCAACKVNGSPWGWAVVGEGMGSAFQLQHPAPVHTDRQASQAGEYKAVLLICLCRLLFILPYSGWLVPSPPWLQSFLSTPADLPTVEGPFLSTEAFLLHSFLPGVQFPFWLLYFSFILLSYPVMGGVLALSEVWGLLPVFSRYSVWIVTVIDVFLMYLWE